MHSNVKGQKQQKRQLAFLSHFIKIPLRHGKQTKMPSIFPHPAPSTCIFKPQVESKHHIELTVYKGCKVRPRIVHFTFIALCGETLVTRARNQCFCVHGRSIKENTKSFLLVFWSLVRLFLLLSALTVMQWPLAAHLQLNFITLHQCQCPASPPCHGQINMMQESFNWPQRAR